MHLMQLMRLVPLWQFPSFMLSRCNGKVLTALEAAPSRQGCSGGTRSVLSEVLQPSLRVVPLPPHKASAMGGRHSWVCGALNFWTSGNLQLADLRCAEVNEVTGQASDLMSALKSSDWHHAVTKSFWHIGAHCTLAASCIKHTGVFTVAHSAILHRECLPLKNNCAESMILSIKIWSLIWTPFFLGICSCPETSIWPWICERRVSRETSERSKNHQIFDPSVFLVKKLLSWVGLSACVHLMPLRFVCQIADGASISEPAMAATVCRRIHWRHAGGVDTPRWNDVFLWGWWHPGGWHCSVEWGTCCWVLYNLLVISVKQCGNIRWEANPDSAIRVGDRIVAVDQSVGKGLTACLKLFKVG